MSARSPFRPCPVHALAALLLAPALAAAAPIQITQGPYNAADPSLSGDGQRLVFASASQINGSNADHSWDVFRYDRATGQTQAISNFSGGPLAGGNQTPKISADGHTVLFQNFEARPGNTVAFRSLVDAGAGAVPLTGFGIFETGALSADGRLALLDIANDGLRLFDLGQGTNRLLHAGNSLSFAFSADGRFAARSGFFGDVQLIDVATGAVRQIAAGTGSIFDADLALSGDGHWLAFTSTLNLLGHNADRNAELYLMNLDSGVLRQLTDGTDARVLRGPSLSQDGSRLVFSSQRDLAGRNADGGEEVYLLDLASNALSQLSEGAVAALQSFSPTISGDGLTAAWIGLDPGNGSQVFLDALSPRTGQVPEPAGLVPLALVAALVARRIGRCAAA